MHRILNEVLLRRTRNMAFSAIQINRGIDFLHMLPRHRLRLRYPFSTRTLVATLIKDEYITVMIIKSIFYGKRMQHGFIYYLYTSYSNVLHMFGVWNYLSVDLLLSLPIIARELANAPLSMCYFFRQADRCRERMTPIATRAQKQFKNSVSLIIC